MLRMLSRRRRRLDMQHQKREGQCRARPASLTVRDGQPYAGVVGSRWAWQGATALQWRAP
jgi:hypothetical protein